MSKNIFQIGNGDLTFEDIERIINENLKLELSPAAKERIEKCRNYLDRKIEESTEPLYGITTGFGSLCTKNISLDEPQHTPGKPREEPRLQCRQRNSPCNSEAHVPAEGSCAFIGS